MSRTLFKRLLCLEERHEGQEPPRPTIVAIHGLDGIVRANIPGQTDPEIFTDEAALEARADDLGLRCICVRVINGRRGAAVQEKATCAA